MGGIAVVAAAAVRHADGAVTAGDATATGAAAALVPRVGARVSLVPTGLSAGSGATTVAVHFVSPVVPGASCCCERRWRRSPVPLLVGEKEGVGSVSHRSPIKKRNAFYRRRRKKKRRSLPSPIHPLFSPIFPLLPHPPPPPPLIPIPSPLPLIPMPGLVNAKQH